MEHLFSAFKKGADGVMVLTCGRCSSSCPARGIDGFDPRKLIRMLSLGFEDAVVESRWPWIFTLCAKCENVCPMKIMTGRIVEHMHKLEVNTLM